MNRLTSIAVASLVLGAISFSVSGCGSEGFTWPTPKMSEQAVPDTSGGSDTSDNTNPNGSSNGGNNSGGDTTPSTDKRFEGTWLASFGDDFPSGASANEYAARLDLKRVSVNRLTGTGKFFRFFRQGQDLWDEFDVTLAQGSTANDYAQITLSSPAFDSAPTWYLRLSTGMLSGMYAALDGNGNVVRRGHALWYLLDTYSIDGDWISGFQDAYSVNDPQVEDGGPIRHRTAGMTVNARAGRLFSGKGDFVELREPGNSLGVGFSVNDGSYVGPEAAFTFDEFYAPLDPSSVSHAPMYWKGFYTSDYLAGAFGQFNSSSEFTRFGHATWRHVPADLQPSAVNGTWVSAFRDTLTTEAEPPIFLGVMRLEVRNGGSVSGSNVQIRQETGEDAEYQRYSSANGQMEALALNLELGSTGHRIVSDLYPADGVLAGSYQRFNPQGDFLGRGVAEWWPERPNTTLEGSWAASYADAVGAGGVTHTALGYVTIGPQTSNDLSGTGSILSAGEQTPKSFSVSGILENNEVQWRWSGRGLSGDTIWRLRQSGPMLVGTYTNYNNVGDVESRGSATWLRTSAK